MDPKALRIAVIGLGKLGAPIAACFAARGFEVVGADVDPKKVERLGAGLAPVYEPGLQALLEQVPGRLRATTGIEEAAGASDVSIVVVPTPSDEAGGFALVHVLDACRRIGVGMAGAGRYHLVVITSTVMPGATGGPIREALEEASGLRCGEGFGLCYSPEFVALGSVIRDFLNPDLVLIGESDPRAGDILEAVYREVCENDPPVARMNFVSAELAKLAVNTFVTAKISFANLLARICEQLPGADADTVTRALGLDGRIGPRYLKGAISYGGPCFPRDNRALACLARRLGVPADLPEATDRFNRWQLEWLAELVASETPRQGTVGILGVTYKPGTDVVEEAAGFWLATLLAARGVRVLAYDPAALPAAGAALPASVELAPTAEECVCRSDVVVLTTPWPDFSEIPPGSWARNSPPRTVIDCWGALGGLQAAAGVRYLRVGRSLGDTSGKTEKVQR